MKFKKLNSRGFSHDIVAVFIVLIFAIAGVGYLVASHADPATSWTSSNQWGSFVYGVSTGTTSPITHSQSTNLNLQFNGSQTGYHTSDMAYYEYTLPASTTATSLTMNVSYVNAGFDTDFVSTGTPSNMVWKVDTASTQASQSVTVNLSNSPTVIYFGVAATGANGGVSGTFPASRTFTVNSYTLSGTVTTTTPVASFTSSPATPTTGQAVQYTSTSTCADAPCNYSYSNQQASGSYAQFATTPTASFTYQNVGTKVVQLTVTDAQGRTSTVTQNIAVVAATGSTTPTTPPVTSTGGKLPWAPPTLTAPTTVNVTGGDPDVLNLSTSKDYIVKLPSTDYVGTVRIIGGRNVELIGGHITVPNSANQQDNDGNGNDVALRISDNVGTVFVEGVLIDGQDPGSTMFDVINTDDPNGNIQLENIRADNVWGTFSRTAGGSASTGEHADVIQTWGGAKSLDIYNFTAHVDYSGFFIGPETGTQVNNYDMRNVNLVDEPIPSALKSITHGGGWLLWLTGGSSACGHGGPMSLTNFYIDNESGGRISNADSVWPEVGSGGGSCPAVQSGNTVSWPKLTEVSGHITFGPPPSGDFVPAGVAGNSYVTPGYL
jgi:hypothetical protein